jgi:hypothetical protein
VGNLAAIAKSCRKFLDRKTFERKKDKEAFIVHGSPHHWRADLKLLKHSIGHSRLNPLPSNGKIATANGKCNYNFGNFRNFPNNSAMWREVLGV